MSLDKEIFLSWCPFVPGQGQQQKSLDKLLCLKSPGKKRLHIYLIDLKIFRKSFMFQNFIVLFQKILSYFQMSHFVMRDGTDCRNLVPRPLFNQDRLSCPVAWQDFQLVHLSQDNEGTSVALPRKVGLSLILSSLLIRNYSI